MLEFYILNTHIFFQLLHFIFNPFISTVVLFIYYFIIGCTGSSLWGLWHCLSLGLEWKLTFFVLGSLLNLPNLLLCWVQHFHSISFRIWNNSAGIPSPPLALFLLIFPKAPLTLHSRKPGYRWVITSLWFRSVTQSCPTLCDPMNCITSGLPVHHQLPESTQTQVHWVSDAIQPSHPLLCPYPPALNLYQHQGLFKWVSSSHQVAKISEFQLQHQSFQGTPRTDLL